jgi:hypothetical protein
MGCGSSKEPIPNGQIGHKIPTSPNQSYAATTPQIGNGQQLFHTAGPSNLPLPANNAPTFWPEASGSSAPGVWPKVFRIPNIQITIYIHSHTISSQPVGDTHCWTYISQGLSQVNQPEVVFTLRRRENENEEQFPIAPVEWMQVVFDLASRGHNLKTG